MEDEILSKDARLDDGDGMKIARDLLNTMSSYRIDPSRIRISETEPSQQTGRSVLFIGELAPAVESRTPMSIIRSWKPGWAKKSERSVGFIGKLAPAVESTTPNPSQTVAVKTIVWMHDAEQSNRVFKSFAYELGLITTLSHPNIAKLLGFVEDIQARDARLILPWEGNGNVEEFLRLRDWEIPERISLIQDTVSGLEYLHTRQPPIRHGDLKPMHILVSSSYRAVITGFWSARIMPNVGEKNKDDHWFRSLYELGIDLEDSFYSLRWTSPELLMSDSRGLPADMWALGWVCRQVVTNKFPFEDVASDAMVVVRVIQGDLPAILQDALCSLVPQLCGLMLECWTINPDERINVSTFRKKARFLPSTPPSGYTPDGPKVHPMTLLLELGRMHDLLTNAVVAEKYYAEALSDAIRVRDETVQANALTGLGGTCNARSLYSEAEESFKKGHEIHSRIGNDLGAANALIGLGESYYGRLRYSEAEETFKEAREIHSRIGDDLGVANALIGLGEVKLIQSRYREAEQAFKDAQKIYFRICNERGNAQALFGLGRVCSARSRYSEAEEALTTAQEIYSRIGNSVGVADAMIGLGEVYDAQSKYSEAKKVFTEAQEIHSRIGNNIGVASALIGLGGVYRSQSTYSQAEKAFKEAQEIHSRTGDNLGVAEVLIGLGEVYSAQSRCSEAEEAFRRAHEIHSRIGNDLGAANALIGAGKIFDTRLRYPEAEKAFMEAHKIHSGIGNDRGTANASVGLGRVYNARSRYSEAEEVLTTAQEIYSRIGNSVGVADAMIGLGEVYKSQSRYSEAKKAFKDAQQLHSHVGNDLGVANVLIGLGELSSSQSRYHEAEKAFTEALGIYSRIGNHLRTANAMVGLGETYDARSKYFESEEVFKAVRGVVSQIGDNLTEANASNDMGRSYDAQSEASEGEEHFRETPETGIRVDIYSGASGASDDPADIKFGAQAVDCTDEESLEEAASIHSLIHNSSGSASMEPAGFIQELSSIKSISMPSTQYIVNLILALAKIVPTAIRNKHQLYRILVISRDLCYYLRHVAHAGGESSSGLDILEQCWEIMDNLERILLELGDIVSQETVPFGASSLATWNDSRMGLRRIYGKLTTPPFNTYGVDDSANATGDRYFDDCSWMSLLLQEGIELPIQNMHPEDEEGFFIEAQNLIDRLNYLVNETKLNGNTDEPTRELFIKILSDLANVMIIVPENPSADFWNAADGALQDIDPEKGLNQGLVDSLRDSWGRFVDRQIQQGPARRVSRLAPSQDPIAVSLPQDLTRLNYEITPAAEPLVLLLQSLGRGAPTAARNKHKIYAIVSRARDICNDILAVGVRSEGSGLETLDEYYSLIEALEGILLDVARLLTAEQVSFGPEMCVSWPENREEFRKILNRLHEPPFRLDPSVLKLELTNSSVFDDQYWLSLLLEEGIEKELGRQYLDIEMPPAVISVREGLRYLENEIKRSYHEESTRELVIDIASRLYEALSASVSEEGSDTALPIRRAEAPPFTTMEKDELVTALSTAFSVLDLESSLESQDIHRLADNWWGSSHSLVTRRPGSLGETEPAGAGSSSPVEPEGQGDQKAPQDSTESNSYWLWLNNFARKRNLKCSRVEVEGHGSWTAAIFISGEDRIPLEFSETGLSKREAREAAARLALASLGEIVDEE